MKKAVMILSFFMAFDALADDCPQNAVRCGTTEDGLTWSISNMKDENGNDVTLYGGAIAQELSIQGTGDMKAYEREGEGIAPWKNPDHSGEAFHRDYHT